ncbi:zinc dependent phospholipase C family protein [Anaerorhabdus sp.]|uniref:zinc dependent phospholipase C family protein n=1 Tax=Anaerorhabdus sp. TaxID=1872524 RepID=UPI002FC97586
MPSLITHELFGKEVCRSLPLQLEKIINSNIEEFSIGTSGPDLFFYYNAWPWKNQEEAHRIATMGGKIHNHNIHDFFKQVFEECKAHQTQEKISYISGLLCHWALDKEAHPYIFNQTESTKGGNSSLLHRRFESHLDYLMLKLIKNQTPKEYPGYKLLKYDQHTVDAVFEVYKNPLHDIYQDDIDRKTIEGCLKDFYQIQKVLYDPKNMKKKLLFGFEKNILKKPYAFTSMIVPLEEDELDILNNAHRTWHHPCTNKPNTRSFVDIFNDSIHLGQEVCTYFFNYLKNEAELDELMAYINNQSFETGLSIESTMRYFDCIYEK